MKKTPYFEETTVGAITIVAIQFLSLPLMIGVFALMGIVWLVRKRRVAKTG
jgi:hypothetical protein